MAREGFGTDPTGMLGRGAPSAGGRGSIGVGVGGGTLSPNWKSGPVVSFKKAFKKGGSTASKRADGCATKGKTKGRFV